VNVTITGASGLVGRRLLKELAEDGHELTVVTRRKLMLPPEIHIVAWDGLREPLPEAAVRGSHIVVHLAGEAVAQRWTKSARWRIRESRVGATRRLVETLKSVRTPPETLICASAVGYYGSRGDEELTEEARCGDGFLAEVCGAWEEEAQAAEALGTRVVRLRIGMVLDPAGGALGKMLPAFRLGLAGKLGSGRQWMSWIHAADLVSMIHFVMAHDIRGVWNAVAPNPVPNAVFTRSLAGLLGRSAMVPVPALGLKLLLGRMSEVLLASQQAIPRAALDSGFEFRFPGIDRALADLLSRSEA
jgi:uncharacterized protein